MKKLMAFLFLCAAVAPVFAQDVVYSTGVYALACSTFGVIGYNYAVKYVIVNSTGTANTLVLSDSGTAKINLKVPATLGSYMFDFTHSPVEFKTTLNAISTAPDTTTFTVIYERTPDK